MNSSFLSIGTNLGDRENNIRKVISFIQKDNIKIISKSSIYETDPVGFISQPKFLNAVCHIQIGLNPFQLLSKLKKFEKSLRRTKGFANAPRTIDLDILLCDNMVINTPNLIIPHPRMLERLFVLVPLMELNPKLINPVSGDSIYRIFKSLKDSQDFSSIKLISYI